MKLGRVRCGQVSVAGLEYVAQNPGRMVGLLIDLVLLDLDYQLLLVF